MSGKKDLYDDLKYEIERCKELIKFYEEIGPAGALALSHIAPDVAAAEQALKYSDTVEMIKMLKVLEGKE